MREVREHLSLLALDGGKDGIDFYIRILREAPAHLKKGGLLLLEIGFDQGAVVSALAEAAGAYAPAMVIQDVAGLDRVIRLGALVAFKSTCETRALMLTCNSCCLES